jgi:hypothetical protein
VVEITDAILNSDSAVLPVGVMMPESRMEISAEGELIIWGKNVMRGYSACRRRTRKNYSVGKMKHFAATGPAIWAMKRGLSTARDATTARSN